MYAEVVLSKATRNIDKMFHYKVPLDLAAKIKVGHQVVVPFGRRRDIGYVVGLLDKSDVKGIKEIIKVTSPDPLFTKEQVELARWVAEYYYSFFITALRLMMPPGIKGAEGRSQRSEDRKQKTVVRKTDGEKEANCEIKNQLKPTPEQETALKAIKVAIDKNQPEKILLHGVTGSGKTEVYLQAIEHVLGQGKTAVALVPEISLTPQLIKRFKDRFQDHIAVLHSHLTLKQRAEEWNRVSSGEARIALGTRSAIFAPVENLGVIVIDEEYETTYKQDKSPRYHVREVAFKLASLHNAVVVMGSATPSVETFYHAEAGKYQKLVLSERIDDRMPPPVEIVDMRQEKGYLLSNRLREELEKTFSRREQAILFINRRGYFTFVMCRECGLTIECPKCSISLVYHSGERKLCCSRCGYKNDAPIICPRCHSSSIKYFGTGTQRIEKEVADVYPEARILRYDRDTVTKRGSHEVFFSTFAEGKADVLIGTQMVTKGLDVANVTLVGVVSADTALQLPDFRAAEHTFQLLTQVAGRAGRHHLPGKVIIQSYTPEHYSIQAAAKHEYETFYKQEIEHRRELDYPPFSKLTSLLVSGPEIEKAAKISEELEKFLRKRIERGVLGPAPAVIPKLRGEWRYQILLKGKDLDKMRTAVREALEKLVVPYEIKVSVDVEPMNML